MDKQTITIPGYMGKPWEIEGLVAAGLILHKMGSSWCITHIKTGCRIGPGDKLQKDCKARMQRLLDLLPDWSAESMEELASAYGAGPRDFADAVKKVAY
jgi:hypothetical protein